MSTHEGEPVSESQHVAVPLVKAGLFVVAEVDGELLCDADQRTLMFHVSTRVAAGTDVVLDGQVFTLIEVVHRESAVDCRPPQWRVPILRMRTKP